MEYIIYKIVCKDINITDCYVGSSSNFRKRKNLHKSNCNNVNSKKHNLNIYKFIRLNGGWNNWNIIEIEKYNCNDKNEAYKRERYWLETLKATLNMQIPSRTKQERTKEYNDKNRDKISKQMKIYYQKQILLKKQKIKDIEIEKLELDIDALELDFLSKL